MQSHSRVGVLTGILLIARDGATKTKIMKKGAFTKSQVEAYLCFLQQSHLLGKEGRNGVFRTTRKGAGLIADYERIDRAIEGHLIQPLAR